LQIKHLAYEYGKRGARLALVARRENRLKEVASKAKSFGSPEVITIPADVSCVQDCKRFVDLTFNHFYCQKKKKNSTILDNVSFFKITYLVQFSKFMGMQMVNNHFVYCDISF
jgi:NAD(P)-dependent dehydrogenase (short-subunit alcohol dehydrogenase family)